MQQLMRFVLEYYNLGSFNLLCQTASLYKKLDCCWETARSYVLYRIYSYLFSYTLAEWTWRTHYPLRMSTPNEISFLIFDL